MARADTPNLSEKKGCKEPLRDHRQESREQHRLQAEARENDKRLFAHTLRERAIAARAAENAAWSTLPSEAASSPSSLVNV